jgi:16S rRNA (cytidine1402-2'-O)-methyltransferase
LVLVVKAMTHEKNVSECRKADNQGVLHLCATPIGNMEDITVRVLRTLREVDIIAAEDTRRTRKILTKYHISNRLISYNEHNRKTKEPFIIAMLLEGKNVALASDAGTPGISDPGAELVAAAIRAGIRVESLPGPAAFLVALTVSGLDTESFIFTGFLPRKKAKREDILRDLSEQNHTLIFYEAPHRLVQTLQELDKFLGDRKAVLCRELTKKFEEVERGRICDFIRMLETRPPRGEYTIVVEGANCSLNESNVGSEEEKSIEEIKKMLTELIKQGLSKKDAVKEVAVRNKLKKRDVYAVSLNLTEEKDQ